MPVEDALAALKAGAARAGASNAKKRHSGGRAGSGPPAQRQREAVAPAGSSFVVCPICGRTVARALLTIHANNECLDTSQQASSLSPSRPPGGAAQPATTKPPSPLALRLPTSGDRPSTAAPSALAALMAAQRAAARVHTLYAEYRWPPASADGGAATTGQWFWHWAPGRKAAAALPPPAWAAESTLNLAHKIQLRLATNVMPGDGGGAGRVPFVPPPPPPPPGAPAPPPPASVRASPSVLKSALQKNVRLGRGAPAVRLALHLLRTDPGDLLRRLGVIMVEDTLLHPALPLCVWAMAAVAKGYTLPRPAVSAILRVVWQLAGAPVRDDPAAWKDAPRLSLEGLFAEEGDGGGSGGGAAAAAAPTSLASQLPPEARLLVRCLAARAAYGGMACDVAMLRDAAGVWAARLAGAAGHPPVLEASTAAAAAAAAAQPPPPDPGAAWLAYIWRAVGAVPPPPPGLCDGPGIAMGRVPNVADVPLSAIDFHVSGVADDALLLPPVAAAAAAAAVRAGGDAAGIDAAERLRRAMWVFRSSINRRPRVVALKASAVARDKAERADLLPLWRAAAAAVDAWAADYIKGRFPAAVA